MGTGKELLQLQKKNEEKSSSKSILLRQSEIESDAKKSFNAVPASKMVLKCESLARILPSKSMWVNRLIKFPKSKPNN